MRTFILLCVCIAASSAVSISKVTDSIPGQYIIELKEGYSVDYFVGHLEAAARSANSFVHVTHKYKSVLNGFSASISDDIIDQVSAMPGIALIEQDSVVRTQAVTWGLDRIDQRSGLDGNYSPSGTGSGVNVYVVDTGISASHNDFGGRATAWAHFTGSDGVDCNGHGTHCAGTVGSATYGVAKNVRLYGVRVLGCTGSGSNSGVIAGMDHVANNGARPGVVSMSLGGGASSASDNAVNRLVNAGFTVVVAAGNSNANACSYSPARAPNAITVGSIDSVDQRASSSNYGTCLDIFAPGRSITSTWIGSNSATRTISGTSMACPHVAGAAALYLQNNTGASVSQVTNAILGATTTNAVSDPGSGSPNKLLYV